MDFNETLRQFAVSANSRKAHLKNEEMTKTSLILPFFQILGYDIFNPLEVVPEYIADVGIKKGEKVDYAIIKNGAPVILIEAKSCNEDLNIHTGQLYRYFSVTTAKFGILTNGIDYKFYTDLEAQHKMDLSPFLEFNITDLKEDDIIEIKKFHKDIFNIEEVASYASELRYLKLIKNYFISQMQQPTDDFINFILGTKVNDVEIYGKKKVQSVIEKFKPIIKKSFINLINDEVNKRVSAALTKYDVAETETKEIIENTNEKDNAQNYFYRKLEKATIDIQNIYNLLKNYIISLGNKWVEKQADEYIAYKKDNSNKRIITVYMQQKRIPIYIHGQNKSISISNMEEFENAKVLIEKAYKEN